MNFRMIWMGPDDDSQDVLQSLDGIESQPGSSPPSPYAQRGTGIVRQQLIPHGRLKITPLANFHARIVQDVTLDDGERKQREFEIEANLDGATVSVSVGAEEFGRMGWVLSKLGPQAIIYPGQHQHARAAIQSFSGSIAQKRIFTHSGWRQEASRWIYLHGGGALGADGPVSGIDVRLPAPLQAYRLPPLGDDNEQAQAVRESLRFLDVAADRITFPLLAGVYRAAFGHPGFSLFLLGPSGVFKTTLAALCQQHYGAAMDAIHLPAHFASTANALESLAFSVKDALLVLDDFAPTGTQADRELHSVAERVFRGAGNQQGRNRMSGDGRLHTPQPPRALVLATGEEAPKGRSLRARLLMVELGLGDVDSGRLNECQQAARQGRFAGAMAGFLSWIAGQYEQVQQRLCGRVEEIRRE
jgi:hypothetical protein